MKRMLMFAVLMLSVSGCKKEEPVPTTAAPEPAAKPAPTAVKQEAIAVSAAPAEWKPALERGEKAMTTLQKTLFVKLQGAMTDGGVPAAIAVCRDDAEKLSAGVAKSEGLQLGRTSHKVRNPNNAPRDWVKPLLADAEGKKVEQVQPMAVDLGDRIGMVKPLGVQPLCVSCHGPKDRIPADVQAVIAQAYPEDQATGFAEGDFRGFIWTEIPK